MTVYNTQWDTNVYIPEEILQAAASALRKNNYSVKRSYLNKYLRGKLTIRKKAISGPYHGKFNHAEAKDLKDYFERNPLWRKYEYPKAKRKKQFSQQYHVVINDETPLSPIRLKLYSASIQDILYLAHKWARSRRATSPNSVKNPFFFRQSEIWTNIEIDFLLRMQFHFIDKETMSVCLGRSLESLEQKLEELS